MDIQSVFVVSDVFLTVKSRFYYKLNRNENKKAYDMRSEYFENQETQRSFALSYALSSPLRLHH